MIIPTPEFDPLFADDGIPFAEKMSAVIRQHFADLISDADLEHLLNQPGPGTHQPGSADNRANDASRPSSPRAA